MSHFETAGSALIGTGAAKQYTDQVAARPATPIESELARLRAPLAAVEKMLADLHDRLRPVISSAESSIKANAEPEPPCSPLESDLREIKSRILSLATRLEVINSGLRL